jgi:hypothetical protein
MNKTILTFLTLILFPLSACSVWTDYVHEQAQEELKQEIILKEKQENK